MATILKLSGGPPGAPGVAATLALGTITTGAAGSSVVIANVGTSSAAILNITIPRGNAGIQGDLGATGATGATGPAVTLDAELTAYADNPTAAILANMPDALTTGVNPNLPSAYGYFDILAMPTGVSNTNFSFGGASYFFGISPADIPIGVDEEECAVNAAVFINANDPTVTALASGVRVRLFARVGGTGGNAVPLVGDPGVVEMSGANLTGGSNTPIAGDFFGQLCQSEVTGIWYRWTFTGWQEDAGASISTLEALAAADPAGFKAVLVSLGCILNE